MNDDCLTEVQIRFQCEVEGTPMPDEVVKQLAEARACRLHEVNGRTTMIVNVEGVEILKRYAESRSKSR